MRKALIFISLMVFLAIFFYTLLSTADMENFIFVGVAILFIIDCYILILLPYIFVFKKADRKIWEALVPFYNAYMLGKIAKDKIYGWAFLIITSLSYCVSVLFVYNDAVISISSLILSFFVQCIVYIALANRFNGGLYIKMFICIPVINYFVLLYLGLSQKCVYTKFTKNT